MDSSQLLIWYLPITEMFYIRDVILNMK